MSPPEPNHEEVCMLLRWKSNEQPPPGYFHSFSDKVLARIEAEDGIEPATWWNWMAAQLSATPVLVCAYGLAVSGLLLLGFRVSQAFEEEVVSTTSPSGSWLAVTPSSPILSPTEIFEATFPGSSGTSFLGATKLAFQEDAGSLFSASRSMRLQHAGFSLAGH